MIVVVVVELEPTVPLVANDVKCIPLVEIDLIYGFYEAWTSPTVVPVYVLRESVVRLWSAQVRRHV